MSLIQLAPGAKPPVEPLIPNVQSTPAQSTIVDTSIYPRNTLIAYMEGAPWLVNYYQRTLSKDMALTVTMLLARPLTRPTPRSSTWKLVCKVS